MLPRWRYSSKISSGISPSVMIPAARSSSSTLYWDILPNFYQAAFRVLDQHIDHVNGIGHNCQVQQSQHNFGTGKAKQIGSHMYLDTVDLLAAEQVGRWIARIEEYGGLNIQQG